MNFLKGKNSFERRREKMLEEAVTVIRRGNARGQGSGDGEMIYTDREVSGM